MRAIRHSSSKNLKALRLITPAPCVWQLRLYNDNRSLASKPLKLKWVERRKKTFKIPAMFHQYHTPSLLQGAPHPHPCSTASELKQMLLDNTKNSTETLHTEWQSRRCNPMPFLGFIMSMVIGGGGGGQLDMSRHSWVQTAPSFSKATLCSQINPDVFSLTKPQRLTAGLKAPNPSIGTQLKQQRREQNSEI